MPEDDHAPPPRPDDFSEAERGEGEKKGRFERKVPEIFKRAVERAIESGATRLAEGPENVRHFLHDMKLPKEVLHYLYQQVDETKNGIYRVVAKEIRDVLEQTKFADELTQVLTKLSFEIKTEIRFIPNDAARSTKKDEEPSTEEPAQTKLPKPDVVSQVTMKGKDKDKDARR